MVSRRPARQAPTTARPRAQRPGGLVAARATARQATLRRASKPRASRIDFDVVREMARCLPGVEDAVSYGTPSLKAHGKFLVRLKEDGETLVLRIGFLERDAVLVRLSKVKRRLLEGILRTAWRDLSPKRVLARFDAASERSRRARS